MIEAIAKDIEPVEFLPGKEGLVHISKLDKKRVERSRRSDTC